MIKVYCYSKCSTCKRALSFLDENNIKYELIDIKSNNPKKDELINIRAKANVDIKKLFNTSGLLYKELKLSEKMNSLTDDEKFNFLASDGMLVKRPLVIADDFVLIGFKIDEWKEKLGV